MSTYATMFAAIALQRELLKIELEEDKQRFQLLLKNKPFQQRIAEGLIWYPLIVQKVGFMVGDRAFVIVEMPTIKAKHQFRTGHIVSLFTRKGNADPDNSAQGVINYLEGAKMKIVLYQREIPEWLNEGHLGVELVFDDRTYREMDDALHQLTKEKGSRLAQLRDIAFGVETAVLPQSQTKAGSFALNESQNEALRYALGVQDFCIIHGPPGTGKTTTVVELVEHLASNLKSVLLSTPSNSAADLLTERLDARGLRVVRIGNISRVSENLIQLTLEGQLSAHSEYKQLGKMKIKAAELRKKADRHLRHFDNNARIERKQQREEAKELDNYVKMLERRLLEQILTNAQAVVCTLTGAGLNILENHDFDVVIIDEASQALEPATWIPIAKGKRIILTGDPHQLPPTVKSLDAAKRGLGVTLLDRLIALLPHKSLLTIQYRMEDAIMGFSNQLFYNGQLRTAPLVALRPPLAVPGPTVLFIDTAGCSFDEQVNPENQSRFNPEEYYILRENLYAFYTALPEDAYAPSIGVISPYREQVIFIKEQIQTDDRLSHRGIEVHSIDGFQGRECDLIYISLVRSNTKQEIGFLSDARRLNVALTRARHRLTIIGDSATIGQHPLYAALIQYCEAQPEGYLSAWAFMEY